MRNLRVNRPNEYRIHWVEKLYLNLEKNGSLKSYFLNGKQFMIVGGRQSMGISE